MLGNALLFATICTLSFAILGEAGRVEGAAGSEGTAEGPGAGKKFTGTCSKCGKVGHKAADCWSKGGGKGGKGGGGKTSAKGAAKGGKPHRPCWTCGGPHGQRDCPKNVPALEEEESAPEVKPGKTVTSQLSGTPYQMTSTRTPFTCQGKSPIQIFWDYHASMGFKTPPDARRYDKVISSKKQKQQDIFVTYTFSPNPPNNKPDDMVFQKNPFLRGLLYRGMTLVFDAVSGDFIIDLTGPCKFSGNDSRDDDDGSGVVLFSMKKAKTWASENKCVITQTAKANGKFVLCKLFFHQEQVYIIFGSKNVHRVVKMSSLASFLEQQKDLNDILLALGHDILRHQESLFRLLEYFTTGNWTLIGELEDGMHFTPGDNTVAWIGLFRNGISVANHETIQILNAMGLRTVSSDVVYTPDDSIDKFNRAFQLARCSQGEGDVLVVRNIVTGEEMLCKSKSASYIGKRMAREKWKANPTKFFEGLMTRFVATADYHGLGTEAAIRFTQQLFDFAIWMGITKGYPAAALGHQPVVATRGVLPNGFNNYWQEFLAETGAMEISFTQEDFVEFNKVEYLGAPELDVFPVTTPGKCLFMQAIQGTGKSTVANLLQGPYVDSPVIVEQDLCWGDTKVAQFQLMWHLLRGRDVVVSRCNTNTKQYKAYLKIAIDIGAKVFFATGSNTASPLYLAVALAGVKHRSTEGDNMMVGRREYPMKEVAKFTTANWKDFKAVPNAVVIPSFRLDTVLEKQATTALKTNNMVKFVESHQMELMALRLPLAEVVAGYQILFDSPPPEAILTKTIADTTYVGLVVVNRAPLVNAVKTLDPNFRKKDKIVCGHLTQVFNPKKVPGIIPVPVGEQCMVTIDALVIRDKDGASAFRVSRVTDSNGSDVKIASGKPHITAMLAGGSKPADSRSFVFAEKGVTVILVEMTIVTMSKWN